MVDGVRFSIREERPIPDNGDGWEDSRRLVSGYIAEQGQRHTVYSNRFWNLSECARQQPGCGTDQADRTYWPCESLWDGKHQGSAALLRYDGVCSGVFCNHYSAIRKLQPQRTARTWILRSRCRRVTNLSDLGEPCSGGSRRGIQHYEHTGVCQSGDECGGRQLRLFHQPGWKYNGQDDQP